jgi:hypothetical protein
MSRMFLNRKKVVGKYIILIIFFALALAGISKVVANSKKTVSQTPEPSLSLAEPLSQQEINQEFQFPLIDASGEVVSQTRYLVENAEIRDEIVVRGQKASAIEGRAFLILNIKVTNDYNQSIEISTKDYLRLGVNNQDEWFAADIHNDPTEVQAISTKRTRLGFPISRSDTNMVLQIGQIDGDKQTIPLTLSF